MRWKSVGEAVEDVLYHCACWTCYHANYRRHEGEGTLALRVKQPFSCQTFFAFFKLGQKRADARRLKPVYNQLIF